MTERLTTLAAVKEWLDITTNDSDELFIRLIDSASQFILNWLNRDSFQVRTYTQTFRGNGRASSLLAHWPVISIASVGVGGLSIPAATRDSLGLPSSGFITSENRGTHQSVELYGGYGFTLGAPAQVTYTAGFTTEQAFVVPTGAPPSFIPTQGGVWSRDRGVILDGSPIVVTDNTSPAAGFYHVDEWGTYTFHSSAVGKNARVSYDYTPSDVSFAVTEMIGEWYKRRDRIGVLSKNLGGQESVTFSRRDFSKDLQEDLQNYKNVVPL